MLPLHMYAIYNVSFARFRVYILRDGSLGLSGRYDCVGREPWGQPSWREWMSDEFAVHVFWYVFDERDGDADNWARL